MACVRTFVERSAAPTGLTKLEHVSWALTQPLSMLVAQDKLLSDDLRSATEFEFTNDAKELDDMRMLEVNKFLHLMAQLTPKQVRWAERAQQCYSFW